MRTLLLRALAGVCLFVRLCSSSSHPDSGGRYQRIVCVVPLVGSGTVQDPKRPLFTLPSDLPAESHADRSPGKSRFAHARILAFQSVPTDDGQAAIVIFVAHQYSAFRPILSSSQVIKKFERKDINEHDLINQLREHKKNFNLQMLRVGAL